MDFIARKYFNYVDLINMNSILNIKIEHQKNNLNFYNSIFLNYKFNKEAFASGRRHWHSPEKSGECQYPSFFFYHSYY